MRAFAEKVEIVVGEQRREGVGVQSFEGFSVGEAEPDAVGIDRNGRVSGEFGGDRIDDRFEEAFGNLASRGNGSVLPNDFCLGSAGPKQANRKHALAGAAIQCGPRI